MKMLFRATVKSKLDLKSVRDYLTDYGSWVDWNYWFRPIYRLGEYNGELHYRTYERIGDFERQLGVIITENKYAMTFKSPFLLGNRFQKFEFSTTEDSPTVLRYSLFTTGLLAIVGGRRE